MTTTNNPPGNGTPARLPDPYWHLTQASLLLQRFITRPEDARLDALNTFLRAYAAAVRDGHVQAPIIYGD